MRDGEGKEVGEQGWVVWFVAVLYKRRCVFIESTWGWCCLKSACFALLFAFFFALLCWEERKKRSGLLMRPSSLSLSRFLRFLCFLRRQENKIRIKEVKVSGWRTAIEVSRKVQ